jgi:L-lactate dehydrogenase complex protein LldG
MEAWTMASARDDIVQRIRRALGPHRPPVEIPRDYQCDVDPGTHDLLDLLVSRLRDYGATVVGGSPPDLAALLGTVEPRAAVVPRDLADRVPSTDGVDIAVDDGDLTVDQLDRTGAALVQAAVAIADTGTLVLDHTPGRGAGRRCLSLLPDTLICLVPIDGIVPNVPSAVRRLDPTHPHTFISGPSATSDIELRRVQGVHGPRRLHVVTI